MKKLVSVLALSGVLSLSAYAASCDTPEMKGMVSGINKNVPQRVDNVTTLTKVECNDGSLKYVYELNDAEGINFGSFDANQMKIFTDVQTNILKNMYCTQLAPLHAHTNSVVWTYNMKDKKFAEFEFKPSDCAK